MSERSPAGYDRIQIAGGDTAQPMSLAKRLRLLQKHYSFSGLKVIDCGCGAGGYVMEFLKLGADACGIEFSEEKVNQFKAAGKEPDRVKVGDLQRMDFPDRTFDFALLNEVLEHVPDDRRALAEVFRILKPHGTLAVFSPNRLYPFETHGVTCRLTDKPLPPHWTPFVPYVPLFIGKHFFSYWARNYFPGELRRLLEAAGFQIVHRTYFWQTFENISGRQPGWMWVMRPALRKAATLLERTPVLRRMGVSQVILAARPEAP